MPYNPQYTHVCLFHFNKIHNFYEAVNVKYITLLIKALFIVTKYAVPDTP